MSQYLELVDLEREEYFSEYDARDTALYAERGISFFSSSLCIASFFYFSVSYVDIIYSTKHATQVAGSGHNIRYIAIDDN